MVLATVVASLAIAAPICHGQHTPPSPAQQERATIERYMEQRAEFGFRADEAYVRELIRRDMWEYDVGYMPATPAENRYLRLRDRLELGRKASRYLRKRRDLSGGISVEDDWPREPYLLVRLTRDRAAHEGNLKRIARFPDNLRTVLVRHSYRRLRQVQDRIDAEALEAEGFHILMTAPDIDTNTVAVELVTKRTDAAAYFQSRYGPVTVTVVATEPTYLECEDTTAFAIARDGRTLTLHWIHSGSVDFERLELTEHADRVEVGIVARYPHGFITDDAVFDEHRIRLSRPLGDRAVIDMADRRRVLQTGPSPGEPPCRRPTRLEREIAYRKELGLPHGRAHVRRLLRRSDPFTTAESRWLDRRERLFINDRVRAYARRHRDEFGDISMAGRFPRPPVLVVHFTRRLHFHERRLARLVPARSLRVVRARGTAAELEALSKRISDDAQAGDGFLGGFGDAGFYYEGSAPERGRLVVRVRTPRRDAARYFRRRYGRAVKVVVIGRRYECRD